MNIDDKHETVRRILGDILTAANDTIIPGIVADRVGNLSEATAVEISKGKRRDLRIPRMLSVSGKGGPGFESNVNVALFDHSSSVAMGSATCSATDLIRDGQDEDTASRCAAVCFVVGMLHDTDKLLGIPWSQVTAEVVEGIYGTYRVADFLARFRVSLSAAQFAALIATDETRTSLSHQVVPVPDTYRNVVRRYVRFADKIDSIWLKGLPRDTAPAVALAFRRAIQDGSVFLSQSAMEPCSEIVLGDPHHPFLLAKFGQCLSDACEKRTGLPPLFHAVRDEMLVSLVPESLHDELIDVAADALGESLSFDTVIGISPAGLPKLEGASPTFRGIQALVRDGIADGKLGRLLAVKVADIAPSGTLLPESAADAGCAAADISKPKGQTIGLVRVKDGQDVTLDAASRAGMISLAIGIEQETRDKLLTRENRQDALREMLGDDAPTWADDLDALTRRTVLALAATRRCEEDQDFTDALFEADGLFPKWFAADGLFRDRTDRSPAIRRAVSDRFRCLAKGRMTVAEPGPNTNTCLVTGEPISGEPIEKADGLYGIKSSAFSYREGRSEQKFTEAADTHLSPTSYAEFRLRKQILQDSGMQEGGIPVRISVASSGGIFSMAIGSTGYEEYGLYDLARAVTKGRGMEGLGAYLSEAKVGRFEELPKTFAERIGFFRLAMQGARRFGRSMHIFAGLPHARREFFYADCLDPDLRRLLGANGLRLEQIPDAISKLEVVEAIAAPRKESGLGSPDLARRFCTPGTRFGAACQAWCMARDRPDDVSDRLAPNLFKQIIKEVDTMTSQGNLNPIVKLGRLSVAIQRAPTFRDGANDEAFLFRTAMDAAAVASRSGTSEGPDMIAYVAGAIRVEGERRQKGSKGFYSRKATRDEGQKIDDAIEAFARCFVDEVWVGLFRGRFPVSATLAAHLAAYRWSLVRGLPRDTDPADVIAA